MKVRKQVTGFYIILKQNKMPLYSASEIIGKTLYAVKPVPVKSYASDIAPTLRTIQPGNMVGKVYSYLSPNAVANRTKLFWQIQTGPNSFFYVAHEPGVFSESDIREQGAETTLEKITDEKNKNESTKQFIERLLKFAMIGGIVYGIAKTWIAKK